MFLYIWCLLRFGGLLTLQNVQSLVLTVIPILQSFFCHKAMSLLETCLGGECGEDEVVTRIP